MMRPILSGTALALTLALGGCLTGSGPVYHVDDPYLFLSYAAGKGSVPVVVTGAPSPEMRGAIEQAAIRSLQSQFPSLASSFVPAGAAPGEGTKVVLMMNVGGYPAAHQVCRDDSRFAGASGPITAAAAVYCGVGPYSEAVVKSDAPITPGTPEFQAFIDRLIYEGVPRQRNPERDGNRSDRPIP